MVKKGVLREFWASRHYVQMNYHINKYLYSIGLLLFFAAALPLISHAEHVNPKCCNYPAKPGSIKIQFFLEACAVPGETEKGMVPYFDCQSYVLGIIDAYRKIKDLTPEKNQICIPENITTKDVLELIWKAYPNWDVPAERDAGDVIFEVLKKEFPCKK